MRVLLIVCCLLFLCVQSVLAGGVNPGEITSAISKHDAQRLKDLLALGYDYYQKSNTDKDFLLAAVKSGDTEMVNILLGHGIDINSYKLDTSNKAWDGNENLICEAVTLVASDYGIATKKNNQSGSSQRAALKNKTKTEKLSPNKDANDKGVQMIDFLIQKGYKPDQFKNPITKATTEHRLGLVKHLYEKGVPMPVTVFYDVVDDNLTKYYPEVLETIDYIASVGKGDINYRGRRSGLTALHMAVNRNDLELVKRLVAKGAKNVKDGSNKTPLDMAISSGQIEMAKILKNAP